nr:pyocin activator PrtN family protein [uncultured Albidiferax sp.]
MKTELMLLIQSDGRPVLNVADLASLLSMTERSIQNRIYKRAMPFPVFKLADSGGWMAHVSDVAAYIDVQRDDAARAMN